MVLRLMYEPRELVDTSNLSNEEWLSYRRRGIGGSDAAAILGISPWRTARQPVLHRLASGAGRPMPPRCFFAIAYLS